MAMVPLRLTWVSAAGRHHPLHRTAPTGSVRLSDLSFFRTSTVLVAYSGDATVDATTARIVAKVG